MAEKDDKLIFVYNVESGVINLVKDYFHMVFKPETYECNLCAVVSTPFGVKKEWKKYYKSLELPSKFMLRNKFVKKYNISESDFPCVYLKKGTNLTRIITMNEINELKTVEELIDLTKQKLDNLGIK